MPSVCSGSGRDGARRRAAHRDEPLRRPHALARELGATGIVEERGEAGVARIEELTGEFAAGTAEAWGAPRTSKGVPVLSMSSHREPGRSHDRMVH